MHGKDVVFVGKIYSQGDSGAHPEHPIVIPPDSIGPGVPTHPIVLPPPIPAHPIIIPPDAISPGVPAHPIVLPPYYPAHPIVIPPDAIAPGVPTHPIYLPPNIWGGGNEPFPTPPIVIPPTNPPGFWGPNDPRPTPPIYMPPSGTGEGGTVTPPAANVPVHGSMIWLEGRGWTFIPDSVLDKLNEDRPHVEHHNKK